LQIEDCFPEVEEFAREFIESTREWSRFWVNDRISPRRPFAAVPRASAIDQLIRQYLPGLFAEIQLEPGRWS
jgi:hypothetical protein